MSKLGAIFTVDDTTGEVTARVIGPRAILPAAADDSTLEVNSSTGKMQVKTQGANADAGVGRANLTKFAQLILKGNLADTRTGGGVFSVENTYGTDLIVQRITIDCSAGSTGASTVDVGVGATSTTVADDLLDGVSLTNSTPEPLVDNIDDQGTNGKASQRWASGDFITASEDTGDVTGLAGTYEIRAVDMN